MLKQICLDGILLLSIVAFATSCRIAETPSSGQQAPSGAAARLDYAIAIHGGAGVISRSVDESTRHEYERVLRDALSLGKKMLEEGADSLNVVEQVVRFLEDDPHFNAGKGAVFTHEGRNELDASIMDGRTLACGAISGVTTVKNPISLARRVMEKSRHVFFTGQGAEQFADEMGVERVDPKYFHTDRRYQQWQESQNQSPETGTVGAVVLDRQGNLAAATSTGGMTNKRFGRVGDSPVIGAGTYANNRTVAISCTGTGEEFIRNVVAHDISALMEYRGLSLQDAAEEVVQRKLKPGDGGIIAVSKEGALALVFNSEGMFRGAADSTGRFEVAIW